MLSVPQYWEKGWRPNQAHQNDSNSKLDILNEEAARAQQGEREYDASQVSD